MNDTSTTPAYLLLFRNTAWHRDLSPEEIQHTMSQWSQWFNRLVDQGKCKGGHPLGGEGQVITGKARSVSDGPFAEAKEAVAGYFYLEVDTIEEALEIGRECPALDHGMTVEVRPVLANCVQSELAKRALTPVEV